MHFQYSACIFSSWLLALRSYLCVDDILPVCLIILVSFSIHDFLVSSVAFFFPTQRSSFSICCRAALVMMNSLSFCLSVKLLISPSNLNESLAGQSILSCRFFPLNISLQSLLACRESLGDYFLPCIREIFSYYLFTCVLGSFLCLSSFWDPTVQMLLHCMLSQRSLGLSSFLFILFSLFRSVAVFILSNFL